MELLLLLSLLLLGYVLWKRSRGEQPNMAGVAGGCLGLGCLGMILLWLAIIAVFWLLFQLLVDIDLSLSGLGDDGGGRDGGGEQQPFGIQERET